VRERAREALLVALERTLAIRIAERGARDDLRGDERFAGDARVIERETGAGAKRFDAAAPSARARRPGPLVVTRPGQWIVAPFARDRIGAVEHVSMHDDAGTHARTEDRAEHDLAARTGAVGRLRQ